MCIQKDKEFPGLHQGKPARKCDRNFVDPSRRHGTFLKKTLKCDVSVWILPLFCYVFL